VELYRRALPTSDTIPGFGLPSRWGFSPRFSLFPLPTQLTDELNTQPHAPRRYCTFFGLRSLRHIVSRGFAFLLVLSPFLKPRRALPPSFLLLQFLRDLLGSRLELLSLYRPTVDRDDTSVARREARPKYFSLVGVGLHLLALV